jgi:hypothetical protein
VSGPLSPIGLFLDDESVLEVVAPATAAEGVVARAALGDLVSAGVSYVVLGHRRRSTPRLIEPSVAAVELSRLHAGLGVVVAADPDRDHPYNLARRLLSIDNLSGGFAGLLLDPSQPFTQHAEQTTWAGSASRDDVDEYADLVATLWGTFDRKALVGDRATGLFARSELLRRADHTGRWSVRGGLGTPSSIQGLPPLLWWGADAPCEADAVIVERRSSSPVLPEILFTDVAGLRAAPTTGRGGLLVALRGGQWVAAAAALDDAATGALPGPASSLRSALGLPDRTADVDGLAQAFPTAPPVPRAPSTSITQGARA